jgi:hypothetical protein
MRSTCSFVLLIWTHLWMLCYLISIYYVCSGNNHKNIHWTKALKLRKGKEEESYKFERQYYRLGLVLLSQGWYYSPSTKLFVETLQDRWSRWQWVTFSIPIDDGLEFSGKESASEFKDRSAKLGRRNKVWSREKNCRDCNIKQGLQGCCEL